MEINLDAECRQNPEEKVVVDERCYCGHLKSEHHNFSSDPSPSDEAGACLRCSCSRFTWFGWVFSDGSEV